MKENREYISGYSGIFYYLTWYLQILLIIWQTCVEAALVPGIEDWRLKFGKCRRVLTFGTESIFTSNTLSGFDAVTGLKILRNFDMFSRVWDQVFFCIWFLQRQFFSCNMKSWINNGPMLVAQCMLSFICVLNSYGTGILYYRIPL